jgi:uncharacterized delta-60 repeat protein
MSFRNTALAAAMLLAGTSSLPCLAADGDLDPTFGDGGISFLTPDLVTAQEFTPYVAKTLPDGKLLFAGSLDAPTSVPFEQTYRGMFARFNADGSVDDTFGNSTIPGVVELPHLVADHRMEHVESIAILGDGSIIAVGISEVTSQEKGFVLKTDASGLLDDSFGDGGFVLIPLTYPHAVAIDGEGRIVVAGESIDTTTLIYTSKVLRFDAAGNADDTFGDGGVASIAWNAQGNSGYLSDMLLADDGIVVAGQYSVYGEGLGSDFAVAKLDDGGTLDAAFGDGGVSVFHDATSDSMSNVIRRLGWAPGGEIVFAAASYPPDPGTGELVLGALDAGGDVDEAFGDAATPGFARPVFATDAQYPNANALIVQPDGKLVVGTSYEPANGREDFAAFRTTTTGTLDDTFADGGVLLLDLAPDGIYSDLSAMTQQPDGKLVLGGRTKRSDEFLVDLAVVRLLNGNDVDDTVFSNGFDPG